MKTKTIVLSAVVVLALLAAGVAYVTLAGDDDARRTGAITTRSFSAGNFSLEIAGANVGALKSVSGCGVQFDTVVAAAGADKFPTKHASQAKYGPCEIRFGNGLGAAAYQWITDALMGKNPVRNAAIVQADANFKEQSRLQLDNALLTKFTLPALDAASKETAYFEVALAPERITRTPGGGGTVASVGSKSAKALLLSNFRVTSPALPGLKASTVDAWSFQIPVAEEAAGTERLPVRTPSAAQLGDISLLAAEPVDGLDNLVKDQTVGAPKETTLLLELLDSTLKNTLLELSFTGVGLTQADLLSAPTSATETIAKRGFSMYAEGVNLKFNN
jgi:phage tail-like protein